MGSVANVWYLQRCCGAIFRATRRYTAVTSAESLSSASLVCLDTHLYTQRGNSTSVIFAARHAFLLKSNLNNHQWEHLEEKPHKCGVCNQSFAFKCRLKIHGHVHTGETPSHCGKSFSGFWVLPTPKQRKKMFPFPSLDFLISGHIMNTGK